jgi:hypothetical protein
MSIEKHIEHIKTLPPHRKTFMEIMKVHQSEVHMANLLAFFFKSEEKHGLGKVFLKSLFETDSFYFKKKTDEKEENRGVLFEHGYKLKLEAGEAEEFEKIEFQENLDKTELQKLRDNFINNLSKVKVEVEDRTIDTKDAQKRIDLVLSTDKCVVCIEFKINHDLNNPLDTYQERIKGIEREFQEKNKKRFQEKKKDSRDLFFIVLTPYKKPPTESVQNFIDSGQNKFREMILSHFVKNAVKNIPENYFIENVNNPYSQYLIDFIQTINNRAISHRRTCILKELQKNLSPVLKSEYHDKGFIEIHLEKLRYKIRIMNNRVFVIEEWSKDNEYVEIHKTLELSMEGYEAVLNALDEIMEKP